MLHNFVKVLKKCFLVSHKINDCISTQLSVFNGVYVCVLSPQNLLHFQGAGVALVVSLAINLWIGIGTISQDIPRPYLDLRDESCLNCTYIPTEEEYVHYPKQKTCLYKAS